MRLTAKGATAAGGRAPDFGGGIDPALAAPALQQPLNRRYCCAPSAQCAKSAAIGVRYTVRMSRFLKSLSSLVNGNADQSSKRRATEPDAGPSTLTTPLFPLSGSDADAPGTLQQPPRRHLAVGARNTSTDGAETVPPGAMVPLVEQPALHKGGRRSVSSRALNSVVRATTQVALSSHVEPTPLPKVARASPRSSVVLTETEKLRLQIMQVQLRLTRLGLYEGTIDGTMNPDLIDAVRYFQTLKGMRDSGILTSGTLTALGVRSIN